jgi:hypothetical protein
MKNNLEPVPCVLQSVDSVVNFETCQENDEFKLIYGTYNVMDYTVVLKIL